MAAFSKKASGISILAPFRSFSEVRVSQIDYYLEQAERAQRLADKTELPEVRARYIESAEAWKRFVDRAERLQGAQASSTAGIGRSPRLL